MSMLVALTSLRLDTNCLKSVPAWLGNLVQLKELYLNANELVTVPDELRGLTKLEDLRLSENMLELLPRALSTLFRLTMLHLRANVLKLLPDWLGALTALTQMYGFLCALRPAVCIRLHVPASSWPPEVVINRCVAEMRVTTKSAGFLAASAHCRALTGCTLPPAPHFGWRRAALSALLHHLMQGAGPQSHCCFPTSTLRASQAHVDFVGVE
jgi:hypothetical protein